MNNKFLIMIKIHLKYQKNFFVNHYLILIIHYILQNYAYHMK